MGIRWKEPGRVRNESITDGREHVRVSDCVRPFEIDLEFADLATTLRSEEVRGEEFKDVGRRRSRCCVRNGDLGRNRQTEPICRGIASTKNCQCENRKISLLGEETHLHLPSIQT